MHLESPATASAAFYEAFSKRDLNAMMAVWSDADDITCIHPMAPRLTGPAAVGQSWEQIFANSPALRFMNRNEQFILADDMAVQTVHEIIQIEGDDGPHPAIIATNVFRKEAAGWRMVLHHGTPLPRSDEDSGRTHQLH